MDAGEIIEFDEPFVLLQRRALFYDMCKKTGKQMFNHLINLAKVSHFNKYNTNESDNEIDSDDDQNRYQNNIIITKQEYDSDIETKAA